MTPQTARKGKSKKTTPKGGGGKNFGGGGKAGGKRDGAGPPRRRTEGTEIVPPALPDARVQPVRGGAESEADAANDRKIKSFDHTHAQMLDYKHKAEGHAKTKQRLAAVEEECESLKKLLAAAEFATAAAIASAASASPSPTAPAPTSDPAPPPDPAPPKYKAYNSETSKKRAMRRLRKVLCEYPPADHADLLARVIVVDGRGKECGISVGLVKSLLATPRMARVMHAHAEAILASASKYMQEQVFSASSLTAARRLLRLSYRKLEWLRRLLSHDGPNPRVMHPKYSTAAPPFPSIPAMKADEADMLRREGGVTQQEDGRGAVCEDLDRTLCQGIAEKHARGELVSTGTRDDPHIYMWAGDGFMARKKGKWVQLGAILISTNSLNQSPNDSRFVMAYCGGEDYDVLNIRLEDIRPTMQRLAREGTLWDEHEELPPGVGKHVQFALGGDKPWIMAVLGRRNMNHTFFSPSCRCTRENISCLDCEGGQESHYAFDADDGCRRAHVCPEMWLRGGSFVSFVCPEPGCRKRFDSLSDVEAEEAACQEMEPRVFAAWADRFSLEHSGYHWNSGLLLPACWVFVDPLHLFLNLFNVAFDETIDFYLQHEFVSSENKALIVECDAIATHVNATLAAAHITARFGTMERKAFCGNDLRALMSHESVLPDIMSAIRPLYERMEPYSFARDASKARAEKQKAEDRLAKEKEQQGVGSKQKSARVDADDFNETAGISAAAAKRVRKQQAALKKASEITATFDELFEAHVTAMQQAVEGNYKWRVVNLLNGLVQFYEFVHAKTWLADASRADALTTGGGQGAGLGRGTHVTQAVQVRKQQCMTDARQLARDIVDTIGDARQQTYVHDLVYGLHRIFDVALHTLHAGMQGVEHVNKQMELIMVSQCTAANNNRRDKDGKRLLGDVAQTATAIVARSHIMHSQAAASLPSNQYAQMLMGKLGWGSKEYVARTAKRDHKTVEAGAVSRMNALQAGLYSPTLAAAAVSPELMSQRLLAPGRTRRFAVRPSPIGPGLGTPQTVALPDCIEPGTRE